MAMTTTATWRRLDPQRLDARRAAAGAWVSILFGGIAIGIAMGSASRWASARSGTAEVAATFGLTFWAIGFTVGVGCYDYWWGYIRGRADWVEEDHSAHGA